jgi:photosystem II stability/assembly factor-like uncharacterized protein
MDFIMKKNNILNSLTTFLFYLSILFFFIGFNFQDSRSGGWIRQFFPSTMNKQIQDITFTDSLTGYAITHYQSLTDTTFILKTSNGGFNWSIIKTVYPQNNGLFKLSFLNNNTGFVSCFTGSSPNIANLQKTTNGGLNWQDIYFQSYIDPSGGLFVLNIDTIWVSSPRPTAEGGGLYRTINGGSNWTVQYTPGVGGANGYPQSIYFYNRNIGFLGTNASELLKTTNCGVNWTKIPGALNFSDIYFKDSLTGFLASSGIYKTINGGLNWQKANLPNVLGGLYTFNTIKKFAFVNDTLYGVYDAVTYPNYQTRAVIYKSTNQGSNWGYQIPDTSYRLTSIFFTNFYTALNGWGYRNFPDGLVTYSGGDSTIYTGINNNMTSVSKDYILEQNYPNPFNQILNIKYQISKNENGKWKMENSIITLKVFDISGKEIKTLVNKKHTTGEYEVKFDGSKLSSGIYFYTLFVDGVRIDTKKAVLIK